VIKFFFFALCWNNLDQCFIEIVAVREEVLRRAVFHMSQEIAEPKIRSENVEYLTGATGHDANSIYAKTKRLCEVIIIIAVALPALLTSALLALAILWTLGRPLVVTRERVGKGGYVFKQLRFRTGVEGRAPEHQQLTPLGQFLEDSCLAELPQLWNVLMGEMSIVGPCPESPHRAEIYRG
jgi:lipopolysaccharide/colanic/teichoic acid biosynthesis glycosyltransferase